MPNKKENSKPQVILVYKKSKLDLYLKENQDEHYLELKKSKHNIYQAMQASDEAQKRSFDLLQNFLSTQGIAFRTVYRAHFRKEANLVITVGGDGTLLDASHKMHQGVLLGYNSDPERSGGFLCAADQNNIAEILDDVFNTAESVINVKRLAADIDGHRLPYPLLNDLLIAHKNPADTVRYILDWQGQFEEHKSSGVWICGPAGSSGAMISAGGQLQKLTDKRLQFIVREPYCTVGHGLRFYGFVSKEDSLTFVSKMRKGAIYLDGPHKRIDFPAGSHLTIKQHETDLKLVSTDSMEKKREKRVSYSRLNEIK